MQNSTADGDSNADGGASSTCYSDAETALSHDAEEDWCSAGSVCGDASSTCETVGSIHEVEKKQEAPSDTEKTDDGERSK